MKFSTKLGASLIFSFSLGACGQADVADEIALTDPSETSVEANALIKEGRIIISSSTKSFEPNACILPITIRNGTEAPATVSMMQFTVTGTGEPDSGNMFAQTVAPGETNTAQLLFPTRQCDELLQISAPNLTCQSEQADCSDIVDIESAPDLMIKYEPQ